MGAGKMWQIKNRVAAHEKKNSIAGWVVQDIKRQTSLNIVKIYEIQQQNDITTWKYIARPEAESWLKTERIIR